MLLPKPFIDYNSAKKEERHVIEAQEHGYGLINDDESAVVMT
jgi:hypothetical protein